MTTERTKSKKHRALSDPSALYAKVLWNSGEAILISNHHNVIVTANPGFLRLTGYSLEELSGKNPAMIVSPETNRALYGGIPAALTRSQYWRGEIVVQHQAGHTFPATMGVSLVRSGYGGLDEHVISICALERLQQVEPVFDVSERHYRTLTEIAPVGIFHTDAGGDCLFVNQRWCEITGVDFHKALGKGWARALHPDDVDRVRNDWYDAAKSNTLFKSEYRFMQPDGSIKWVLGQAKAEMDRHGKLCGYVGSITDITDHKAAEAIISHLAHHDTLTGLSNRASFHIQLQQALATAARERQRLALLFIDLDRFKAINDTLGHAAGDNVLIEVANRLRKCVRGSDIVARLSGDEFVVVLPDAGNTAAIARIAESILFALRASFQCEEKVLHVTASIGIACYPDDGYENEVLIRHADTAMYHAKGNGRNGVQFFAEEMNASAAERLRWQNDLQQGLASGEFELHYQPQLRIADFSITGVEALVRWRHPRDGLVLPEKFIYIAEETGLIVPLGEWVFDEACKQLRTWKDEGLADISMGINLSAEQLRSPHLFSFIENTLRKYQLAGEHIELEITESVAMQDPHECIEKLTELRKLGIRLAIDDFGTGYSSLSYLKLLPIQCLKLDKAFLQDVERDKNNASICTATIALAHSLGLHVIGEGAETEGQYRFLAQYDCDIVQGHFLSKPVPADQAFSFIRGRRRMPDFAVMLERSIERLAPKRQTH